MLIKVPLLKDSSNPTPPPKHEFDPLNQLGFLSSLSFVPEMVMRGRAAIPALLTLLLHQGEQARHLQQTRRTLGGTRVPSSSYQTVAGLKDRLSISHLVF